MYSNIEVDRYFKPSIGARNCRSEQSVSDLIVDARFAARTLLKHVGRRARQRAALVVGRRQKFHQCSSVVDPLIWHCSQICEKNLVIYIYIRRHNLTSSQD